MKFNIEQISSIFNAAVKTYILSVEEDGSIHKSKFMFDIHSGDIFKDIAKWITQHINMLIQLNEMSKEKTKELLQNIRKENKINDDEDSDD